MKEQRKSTLVVDTNLHILQRHRTSSPRNHILVMLGVGSVHMRSYNMHTVFDNEIILRYPHEIPLLASKSYATVFRRRKKRRMQIYHYDRVANFSMTFDKFLVPRIYIYPCSGWGVGSGHMSSRYGLRAT